MDSGSQHERAPSTIDFTRSLPPKLAIYSERMRSALTSIAADPSLGAFIHSSVTAGSDLDRQVAAAWLQRRFREEISCDRLVVANSTQSAVALLLEALVGKDNLLLAERLSWGAVREVARRSHVRVEGLEIDKDGIVPDAFEAACRRDHPRALYCNPTDQNPTTAIMPYERRHALVNIARHYGVPIIEDDALGLLHKGAPVPLAAIAPDIVWYIMGLTKCLSQGLRIAYVLGPNGEQIEDVFGGARRLSHWSPPPLEALVVRQWILDGTADEITAAIRTELIERERLAQRYLGDHGLISKPASMHVWLMLPDAIDRHAFVGDLRQKGVLLRPADLFSVDDINIPNAVRLSLSSPANQRDVELGIQIAAAQLNRL